MLSLTMGAMLLTSSLNAQERNGGLFGIQSPKENTGGIMNRDGGMNSNGNGFTLGGLTDEDPTAPAPLGSGLLVMVAAGAGYAIVKKNKKQ